VSTSS